MSPVFVLALPKHSYKQHYLHVLAEHTFTPKSTSHTKGNSSMAINASLAVDLAPSQQCLSFSNRHQIRLLIEHSPPKLVSSVAHKPVDATERLRNCLSWRIVTTITQAGARHLSLALPVPCAISRLALHVQQPHETLCSFSPPAQFGICFQFCLRMLSFGEKLESGLSDQGLFLGTSV